MSRKTSIDRLIRRAREELKSVQDSLPTRTERASFDRIKGGLKITLEQLRSVLDYAAQDVAELTPPGAAPQKKYFPFIHPLDLSGNRKTPAQIMQEFTRKPDYQYLHLHIAGSHTKVYDTLKAVQGKIWLSELIAAVNPQKHDDLEKLGPPQIQVGSNVIFQGPKGTPIRALYKADIVIHGQRIPAPLELSIGSPAPRNLGTFSTR
jgi:hypothetical protein